MPNPTKTSAERQLVITRLLNAPRELVWKVWTEPEHIKNWWGPVGFHNSIFQMDVRPGGTWEFIMHGPDGTNYKNKTQFVEVVKPERIVFEHVSWPKHQTTVEFEEQGNKTLLTWTMVFEELKDFNKVVKEFKADDGQKQNVDKLESYLAKGYASDELTLTRLINAPGELIFKAFTNNEMLANWWGPDGITNPVCETDPRPGGRIYIDMQGPDGTVYPMDGEFHEISAFTKIIFTLAPIIENNQRFFELRNTVTLTEENGKTKLTLEVKVNNIRSEARHHIAVMNEEWSQCLNRLINLVE